MHYQVSASITPLLQWELVVLIFVAYLLLVRSVRFRRRDSLQARYASAGRESLAKLTNNDAQTILKDLTELEFPRFFGFSIIFALFKTYGIPSVSSLLVATGQLASLETASKRVADTGVILLEFAINEPTSERAIKAIARMNYLHAQYQKSGKITNDDLLYTLSLFALEPARWISDYEWRDLTSLELAACGTYWKSMGDAMSISFAVLKSHETGWKDGLEWLNEIKEWSQKYEKLHMVPAETNQQLADSHLEILCLNLPRKLMPMCKKMMSVLLGPMLQKAMRYPDPPATYISTVALLKNIRRLAIRYLFLPRPEFMRKKYVPSGPDPKTGRYNSVEYLSYPWYVKPSLVRRWGPKSWLTRLVGRKLPGDDGNKYASEGWTFAELGPRALKGKGIDYMEETEERLISQGRGGCPFQMR